MFQGIDNIPWSELFHAYGPASDSPDWLNHLVSDDERMRGEAIFDFLFSRVFHQYTMYSATPFVVPYIIEILDDPVISRLSEDEESRLSFWLMQWLEGVADESDQQIDLHPNSPNIAEEIIKGEDTYIKFLEDENPETTSYARKLIKFCKS